MLTSPLRASEGGSLNTASTALCALCRNPRIQGKEEGEAELRTQLIDTTGRTSLKKGWG